MRGAQEGGSASLENSIAARLLLHTNVRWASTAAQQIHADHHKTVFTPLSRMFLTYRDLDTYASLQTAGKRRLACSLGVPWALYLASTVAISFLQTSVVRGPRPLRNGGSKPFSDACDHAYRQQAPSAFNHVTRARSPQQQAFQRCMRSTQKN